MQKHVDGAALFLEINCVCAPLSLLSDRNAPILTEALAKSFPIKKAQNGSYPSPDKYRMQKSN